MEICKLREESLNRIEGIQRKIADLEMQISECVSEVGPKLVVYCKQYTLLGYLVHLQVVKL